MKRTLKRELKVLEIVEGEAWKPVLRCEIVRASVACHVVGSVRFAERVGPVVSRSAFSLG